MGTRNFVDTVNAVQEFWQRLDDMWYQTARYPDYKFVADLVKRTLIQEIRTLGNERDTLRAENTILRQELAYHAGGDGKGLET